MLGVVLALLGLVGLGAWCLALYSLVQIVSLAPAGHRVGTLFTLGWWRFDKVKATVGEAATPHLRNYVRSFMAFFAVVIGIAGLSILLAIEQQNGTGGGNAVTAPAAGQ